MLKTLASTEGANASFSTQLLEDIDVYNPNKSDHRLFFCLHADISVLSFFKCFPSFSLFIFFLFFVLTWSLSSSPPLCVLPRSALPTHSLVYCNALHHPVQLEGMLFFSCLLLFSDSTACEVYLHGLRFTAGFLYHFRTVAVICSADLNTKLKTSDP